MIKHTTRIYTRCSRWLSYNPPGALTSEAWDAFNLEFKKNAPIRYWFDNDFRKVFVYPVTRIYDSLTNWVRCRTIDRYHVLTTGLPPGYQDHDNIILHANFNLLKNFVEVDTAIRTYWSESNTSWCSRHVPLYHTFYPFRRPDLGIKHLEWASTLDDPALPPYEQSPQQAVYARELLVLYMWWINIRPTRIIKSIERPTFEGYEPFSLSLPNCDETDAYYAALAAEDKQLEAWHDEDDAMLIRMMKIRRGMWA